MSESENDKIHVLYLIMSLALWIITFFIYWLYLIKNRPEFEWSGFAIIVFVYPIVGRVFTLIVQLLMGVFDVIAAESIVEGRRPFQFGEMPKTAIMFGSVLPPITAFVILLLILSITLLILIKLIA